MKYLLIVLLSQLAFSDFCARKSRSVCKQAGECSWGRWKTDKRVGKFQCKARKKISATLQLRKVNTRSIASIPSDKTKSNRIKRKKKRYSTKRRSKYSRKPASISKRRKTRKKRTTVTDDWPEL